MAGTKRIEYAGQDREGRRANETDLKNADCSFRRPFGHTCSIRNARQYIARAGQQGVACCGQVNVAARAIKQQRADSPLQAGDLAAEGGLGDMQPVCCAPEMQFFRHCQKIAQSPNIDAQPGRVGQNVSGARHTDISPFSRSV